MNEEIIAQVIDYVQADWFIEEAEIRAILAAPDFRDSEGTRIEGMSADLIGEEVIFYCQGREIDQMEQQA